MPRVAQPAGSTEGEDLCHSPWPPAPVLAHVAHMRGDGSSCCRPQMGHPCPGAAVTKPCSPGPKVTEIRSLTVMAVGSRRCAASEAPGGGGSLPGCLQLCVASVPGPHCFAPACASTVAGLPTSVLSPLRAQESRWVRATLLQYDPVLPYILHLQRPRFRIRFHLSVLGWLGLQCFWGRRINPSHSGSSGEEKPPPPQQVKAGIQNTPVQGAGGRCWTAALGPRPLRSAQLPLLLQGSHFPESQWSPRANAPADRT